MPAKGKIIHFDPETYTAIQQLADDRMASLQELADEAFSLLLKKYGRPVGIKAQLKASVSVKSDMATVRKRYRTPPRPKGARAAGVNPRKGEDLNRGGQKTYQDDPDGMQATEKRKRKRKKETH